MVASDASRMSILRQVKMPPTHHPRVIRYAETRRAICAFLADPARNISHLTSVENLLTQRAGDPSVSCFRQNDAKQSIAALHDLQAMQNRVAGYFFVEAPKEQPKLTIAGVEVSVRADVLVEGRGRRSGQLGAAVLRMTKDDATTSAARAKRKDMGLYAAAIVRRHVEQNLLGPGQKVAAGLCMSIDVQHREIFVAPPARTRRMQDIESACQMIAAMWPHIQ